MSVIFRIILWMTFADISMATNQSEVHIPCPTLCKCSQKKHTAICSGHGKNLSTIPELPRFVHQVKLDSDYFPSITRRRLAVLIPNNVNLLSFKSSYVHYMGGEAFADLPNLNTLEMDTNVKLNITSLKLSLASIKNKEIKLFHFDMMRWDSSRLLNKIFIHMNGRYINRLTLQGNVIERIPNGSLDGLEGLKRLDLSKNRLPTCDSSLGQLRSLTEIDLSNNPIMHCKFQNLPIKIERIVFRNANLQNISSFCSTNGSSHFVNLRDLILDNNSIRKISKHTFDCLSYLRHLSLSQNNIQNIPSHTFSSLPRLEILNLSIMKTKLTTGSDAFSIPSLVKFNLNDNNFKFDIPAICSESNIE